ncbi:MAG: helix-turn-helix domain-containing protein [Idiomarina sp.]|nr:helix-turn-helix domain-containing protein [Idiomarina sp.]
MTLGERLKQRRNELELSQPELAEQMGIEQSFLSKLENDRSLPSNETFRRWLQALELSLAEALSPLENSYIRNKLTQISDVDHLINKQQDDAVRQRSRLLTLSSMALALSLPLFYVGYTASIFPEQQYEYMSHGNIADNESVDIYRNWIHNSPWADPRMRLEPGFLELQQKMTERLQEQRIVTFENRGYQYTEEVAGSHGAFYRTWYRQPINEGSTVHRPINGLLQGFGLFFAMFGILGFWRERKLYPRR